MLKKIFTTSLVTIYVIPIVALIGKAFVYMAFETMLVDLWFVFGLSIVSMGASIVHDFCTKVALKYVNLKSSYLFWNAFFVMLLVFLYVFKIIPNAYDSSGLYEYTKSTEYNINIILPYFVGLLVVGLQLIGLFIWSLLKNKPREIAVSKYEKPLFILALCNLISVTLVLVVKLILSTIYSFDNAIINVDLIYVATVAIFYVVLFGVGCINLKFKHIKELAIKTAINFPFATIVVPIIISWLPFSFVYFKLLYIILAVGNILAIVFIWQSISKNNKKASKDVFIE